ISLDTRGGSQGGSITLTSFGSQSVSNEINSSATGAGGNFASFIKDGNLYLGQANASDGNNIINTSGGTGTGGGFIVSILQSVLDQSATTGNAGVVLAGGSGLINTG